MGPDGMVTGFPVGEEIQLDDTCTVTLLCIQLIKKTQQLPVPAAGKRMGRKEFFYKYINLDLHHSVSN